MDNNAHCAIFERVDACMRAIRKSNLSGITRIFADKEVSSTEAMLIGVLGRRPQMTQNEIAQRLMVDPALVSRTVFRLVDAGYVTTDVDPSDRRVRRLLLTENGRTLFRDVVWPRFEQFLRETFAPVSVKQVETLLSILEQIAEGLGITVEYEPPPEP